MRYITAIAAFAAAVSGAAVPAPQAGGTCDVATCGAALANAGIACGRTAKTRWDVADCAVSAGVTFQECRGCIGDPLGFAQEGTCTRRGDDFCPAVGSSMISCIENCQLQINHALTPIAGQDSCRYFCGEYCGCA